MAGKRLLLLVCEEHGKKLGDIHLDSGGRLELTYFFERVADRHSLAGQKLILRAHGIDIGTQKIEKLGFASSNVTLEFVPESAEFVSVCPQGEIRPPVTAAALVVSARGLRTVLKV